MNVLDSLVGRRMRASKLLVILACAPLFAGCAGESDSVPGEEAVGEARQAVLGDIACANSNNTDYIPMSNDYDCLLVDGICSYTTPDGSYGSDWASGEACQPYMNLRTYTGAYYEPDADYPISIQYSACPSVIPTTRSECEATHIELAGYYFDENGSMWRLASTRVKDGAWDGTSCVLPCAEIDYLLTCNASHLCKRDPVVSARVYVDNAWGRPLVKPVSLAISRDP